MKVTVDGMTFEGTEEEIERIVQRYRPPTVSTRVGCAPARVSSSATEEPR